MDMIVKRCQYNVRGPVCQLIRMKTVDGSLYNCNVLETQHMIRSKGGKRDHFVLHEPARNSSL